MSDEDENEGASAEAIKWIGVISRYDEELAANMENMKSPELQTRILWAQQNLLQSERDRRADAKLARAKSEYDRLKGPYDDAKKLQGAIVNLGMLILEERGVELGSDVAAAEKD